MSPGVALHPWKQANFPSFSLMFLCPSGAGESHSHTPETPNLKPCEGPGKTNNAYSTNSLTTQKTQHHPPPARAKSCTPP